MMKLREVVAAGLIGMAAFGNAQADYPSAIWNAAAVGNQTSSNRPVTYPIEYVIIHITEGSYAGAISWFKNETSDVSAHFVIRSSDGQVTQMVRLKDIAWQAGNSFYNQRGIGIEHEAISTISGTNPNPLTWFTDALYNSSSTLTRWITTTYAIPRTRTYIKGHNEVRATSCPSTYWDWNRYMNLLSEGASYLSNTVPTFMTPGSEVDVSVVFNNTSDFTWTTATGNDQVSLRTSPSGRVSPFYISPSWQSSSIVGTPTGNVAPGSNAVFNFRIKAPVAGQYTESFQLYRSSTGTIGPVVSFAISSGYQDKVIDNTSNDFYTSGAWTAGTSSTDKYGTDYQFVAASARSNAFAEWYLNAPVAGTYEVYAWWPQGTNRSNAARYEIRGRRDKLTKIVNQQAGGGTWNLLGRTSLSAGGGYVRVFGRSNGTGAVVMADAVRLVGPIR